MDKLLILGASKGTAQLIDTAHARGVWTTLAGPDGWSRPLDSFGADEIWVVDTTDLDTLERKCRESGVRGVLCGVSQFNTENVLALTKRLGLPCYCTPDAWQYTVNKRAFKDLCIRSGVPVARDFAPNGVPTDEELELIEYPVVVKATDLSANRGMSFCNTKEEVVAACELALSVSNRDKVIIEKMMRGREYTAHYALADGEASLVNFCAMFHEPGYPVNCYSVTTTATDRLPQYLAEVDTPFVRALKAGGATEGVAWLELMLDDDGHFYVLEMGYRMSGDLWALPMRDVCGFDTYDWLIDVALGKKHTVADLPAPQRAIPERCGMTYILWSEHEGTIADITGLEEVAAMDGVFVDSALRVGDHVSAHAYMVVITMCAGDYREAESIVRKINDVVSIVDENGEGLVIKFSDFETLQSVAACGLGA